MYQQGVVRKYIIPNYWILILGVVAFVLAVSLMSTGIEELFSIAAPIMVLSFFPLVVGVGLLPRLLATAGTLSRMKKAGVLAAAEKELSGDHVTQMCRNKVACTEHFLFVRRGAHACAYTDILWVYKHRLTHRFLLIPIHTSESVIVHTGARKFSVDLGRKDKNDELIKLIQTIYQHNPKVLVGYTKEKEQAYKQLIKTRK